MAEYWKHDDGETLYFAFTILHLSVRAVLLIFRFFFFFHFVDTAVFADIVTSASSSRRITEVWKLFGKVYSKLQSELGRIQRRRTGVRNA